MAAAPDAHESLRERARRALMDNPDPELLLAAVPPNPGSQAAIFAAQGAQAPQAAHQAAQGAQAAQAAFQATQGAQPAEGAPFALGTPAPAIEPSSSEGHIASRLRAIAMVRELEPRRACYADRVRELSRSLTHLPEHSVHFRTVLDRLREAHGEWQVLEEQLQAAQYIIRSTQWLVDLLADPYIGSREVAAGEGQ